MQRPKRAVAAKAISYVDTSVSSDDDDQEQLVLNGSSRRRSARRSRSGNSQVDAARSEDDPDARPAKKPRTATTATKATSKSNVAVMSTTASRRRKGQLSAFLALPLDLVLDLARKTDLPTLLSMSRVNELLYRLFASRSAAPIWASARRNSGLPDLEAPDLNDKQLAALLFDRKCHICGSSRAVVVYFALRAHWCKRCQLANLLTAAELHDPRYVKRINSLALKYSLSRFDSARRTTYYRLQDVQSTSDRLNQLADDLARARRIQASVQPRTTRRRTPEQQAELDETLKSAAAAVVSAKQALDAFIEERRVLVEAARKDAAAWVEWERRLAQAVRRAEEAELERRRNVVKEKLIGLGYTATDCDIPTSLDAVIIANKELTDEIWTHISPTLIELAEQRKVERVKARRLNVMRSQYEVMRRRYKALLEAQQDEALVTWPSVKVFQLLPTVEAHWVGDAASRPDDSWAADLPTILAEVDAARRAIKVGFARAIVQKHVAAALHVGKSVVDKLARPRQPIRPIGAALRSIMADLDDARIKEVFEKDSHASLDLGDSAAGVSEGELDSLFAHPTAMFNVHQRRKLNENFRYPRIHAELRERRKDGTVSCAVFASSDVVALVRHQLALLARAGLTGLDPSDKTLGARGTIFPCVRCIAQRRDPSMTKARSWLGAKDHFLTTHT